MDMIEDESIRVGRKLAENVPGKEIVITGMAARFPESDDLNQFNENLINDRYMISNDDRRWKRCYEDTPYSMGKISCHEKFDAGFFNISHRQADFMTPECRQLLERAVEAVLDSGYSLSELQCTKTGVFVGATINDSEKIMLYEKIESPHFGVDVCCRSSMAHQISHHLKLHGPSINVDAACGSSLYCLEEAYRSIKIGKCDNAIIAGVHVALNPTFNQFYYKMGIVSLEGDTLVFDGNGYIRSEGAAVVFMQRARDARRVYAEVVHCKTNVDGFKKEGVTFPSQKMIAEVIKETFVECNVNPDCLAVIEPHATGNKIGDSQELNAIYEALSKNRKSSLPIASVKSSVGHTESVSGLCSMIKILLGMNNDSIYPICRYQEYKNLETVMLKKNLKLINQIMDWPKNSCDLAGIIGYGIGGANGFVILKRWLKDKKELPKDDLPRLVCFSGRTEQCLKPMLSYLSSMHLDEEYVRLYHAIYSGGVVNHQARGFIILPKTNAKIEKSTATSTEITSLCFGFQKLNSAWRNIVQELSGMELFEAHVKKSYQILGVNDVFGINDIVGNVILHAALIDTLEDVGVVPKSVIGCSFGVVSAAYADRTLSLKQVISCAQYIDAQNDKSLNINLSLSETSIESLIKNLQKVINKTKPLTKWILLSNDEECMSAHFIVKHLCNWEVAATALRQDALISFGTANLQSQTSINILPQTDEGDVLSNFLTGLGRIYQLGHDLKLDKLYPKVQFPVSRKTPLISPLIQWHHDEDWFLYRHGVTPADAVQTFDFALKGQDPDWQFLSGHVLDGQCITPMSAFIYMVWDTFSRMTGVMKIKMKVTFENVRMHKNVNILAQPLKKFVVRILKHTQRFEVEDNGDVVLSGKVSLGAVLMSTFFYPTRNDILLSQKDVYTQLLSRGYYYSGLFQGINEYDMGNQKGLVSWNNNWTAFLDNLMRLSLLHNDSKSLNFPIGIGKMSIDAEVFLKSPNTKKILLYKDLVRTPGIELLRISTKIMKRKEIPSRMVLETYKFIPYCSKLALTEAVQVNTQLILENVSSRKLKVIEVIDRDDLQCLAPLVQEAAQNCMNAQAEVLAKVPNDESCDLIIMSNVISRNRFGYATKALNKTGFIISRESAVLNQVCSETYTMVSNYCCEEEQIVLLQKKVEYFEPTVLKITHRNFAWVSQLQRLLQTSRKVLITADDPTSGILGLIPCLKIELGRSDKIQCLFIPENPDQFDSNSHVVQEQLRKGLCVNVLKDGVWGSYRNLELKNERTVISQNAALRNDQQWFAIPNAAMSQILVHYASIGQDTVAEMDFIPMANFSGCDDRGRRIMGLARGQLLSRIAETDQLYQWNVPNIWSLEQAVTVPEAYISALYLLTVVADLKHGTNVLLHALPPSTIEALINVARYYDCRTFILDPDTTGYTNTVGVYAGNINSVLFRKNILKQGGAQVIINGSDKDTITLSNYLSPKGTFVQIRHSNTTLRNNRFIVVNPTPPNHEPLVNKLHTLVQNGLDTELIKPISAKCVDDSQNLIIKINVQKNQFRSKPSFYCDPEQVYVVVGGLGGIGILFTTWLINLRAQKVIVCSRRGYLNGYKKMKLELWRSQITILHLITNDVTTEKGCTELLQFANKFGIVGGIFNLAMESKEALFENHTEETFATPFATKAIATELLDKVSRRLCPNLQYFMGFSSSGLSKGNVGQTNYNMANAVLERICERRKADGYPALVVQWGAIADVGFVTKLKNYEPNKIIGGTMQQSPKSIFAILQQLMVQDETVVLCMLLPKTLQSVTSAYQDDIKNIIGIVDLKGVSRYTTFAEMGMDSITTVDVQSYLETKHGLSLNVSKIRNLTLAKLEELTEARG